MTVCKYCNYTKDQDNTINGNIPMRMSVEKEMFMFNGGQLC